MEFQAWVHTGFLEGATDQNSDSHACTASAFPNESSPVLTHLLAFKTFFSNVKGLCKNNYSPLDKKLINTEVNCGLNVNIEVFCKSTSMKTVPRQVEGLQGTSTLEAILWDTWTCSRPLTLLWTGLSLYKYSKKIQNTDCWLQYAFSTYPPCPMTGIIFTFCCILSPFFFSVW